MTTTPVRRSPGRPRDPGIEPRMHASALAVYVERGWYGFSIEAVARHAGVGQGAVYRRWSTKAELLADAISAGEPEMPEIDTGSSREDLLLLARYYYVSYRRSVGIVGLRMVLDARSWPELSEQFERMTRGRRAVEARTVVRRCLDRGDLRDMATVDFALEVLAGTTFSHMIFAPPVADDSAATATSEADERFLVRLVDSLLA